MSNNNNFKDLYDNSIKQMMDNNPDLQENLCEECLNRKVSPYSLDTSICDKCGLTKECTNVFLQDLIKILKFSPEIHWYNKIPRVYRH